MSINSNNFPTQLIIIIKCLKKPTNITFLPNKNKILNEELKYKPLLASIKNN